MKLNSQTFLLIFITYCFLLVNFGCVNSPLKYAFVIKESVLKKRVLQTQDFRNTNKKVLMFAIIDIMQDLSFKLDETNNDLGLFVGSKRNSFTRMVPRQRPQTQMQTRTRMQSQFINGNLVRVPVTETVPVTVMVTYYVPVVFIEEIRMSIVIYSISQKENKTKGDFLVRATLQKMTWQKSTGHMTQAKVFGGPNFYKDFFSKLSKAVFLETNL